MSPGVRQVILSGGGHWDSLGFSGVTALSAAPGKRDPVAVPAVPESKKSLPLTGRLWSR